MSEWVYKSGHSNFSKIVLEILGTVSQFCVLLNFWLHWTKNLEMPCGKQNWNFTTWHLWSCQQNWNFGRETAKLHSWQTEALWLWRCCKRWLSLLKCMVANHMASLELPFLQNWKLAKLELLTHGISEVAVLVNQHIASFMPNSTASKIPQKRTNDPSLLWIQEFNKTQMVYLQCPRFLAQFFRKLEGRFWTLICPLNQGH